MIPTAGLLRVQPVAPEQPKGEDILITFFLALGFFALGSWLVMLAVGNLHDLFPVIPTVGYWQTVSILLGFNIAVSALRPRAWKWARR